MINDDTKRTDIDEAQVESRSGRTESQAINVRKRQDELVHPKTNIKIGRHGADMIMTSDPEKQERMLSQVGLPEGMSPATIEERLRLVKTLIARSMGYRDTDLEKVPDRIGFNLTNQAERDVLFGVLKLMTESDYKGTHKVPSSEIQKRKSDKNPIPKPEKAIEADSKGYQLIATQTHIGGAYENIPSTPVLIISQSDLVRAVGYDPTISSDRERVAQAVVSLATKQNFLMWTRFARDKKGKVEKRNGRTKFEIVSTFSPVLNVNFVSEKDKNGKVVLKYYEVSLAPVFLDEISREYGAVNDGYFLLIPEDANREIEQAHKDLFPYRVRVSPTIQALCYWLRLQVVEIQSRDRNPFTKTKSSPVLVVKYEDLCRQLNISELSFRRNPSRIRQVVEDGLLVAQKIGYITEFSSDDSVGEYRFVVNFEYYPNRFKQESQEPEQEGTQTPGEGQNEPQQGTIDF